MNPNRDTVCFYMGKAGSSTVIRACESVNIHCSRAYDRLEGPQADYRYVITLAREPVARNLSAFFEEHVDGWAEKGSWPPLERMAWHFLEGWGDHVRPLAWFNGALLWETGLDVYQCEWSPRKGWAVYDHGPRRVLVIRTDKLTKKLGAALRELYGLEENVYPAVEHRGRGAEKFGHGLGEVYSEWVAMVRLPQQYLDWMYGSDYAQHFWFKTELARLRKRWQEG
jgi:hypothetical protein